MKHLKNFDFRIIPPLKIFDEYLKKDVFKIPCNVLEITEISNGNKISIVIERLDFKTGKMIKHNAITYKKSLSLFESLGVNVPFTSECKIVKNNLNEYEFIVYGIFNTSGIINYFMENDSNLSEEQVMQKFHQQYDELNKYLN